MKVIDVSLKAVNGYRKSAKRSADGGAEDIDDAGLWDEIISGIEGGRGRYIGDERLGFVIVGGKEECLCVKTSGDSVFNLDLFPPKALGTIWVHNPGANCASQNDQPHKLVVLHR
jgi:hypothetical protein